MTTMAKKRSKRTTKRQRHLGAAAACPTEALFMQRGFDMVEQGVRECTAIGRRNLVHAAAAMKRGDCKAALQLYRGAMRGCPPR